MNFNIATLTYKTLATGQPEYLHKCTKYLSASLYISYAHNITHILAKRSVYASVGRRRTFTYAEPQI